MPFTRKRKDLMSKFNQDQKVYFRIKEGVEGYATVAGDYDLIVILKPETPLNSYSHIYVSKTQIVPDPKSAPIVPVEPDDMDQPFERGTIPAPNIK